MEQESMFHESCQYQKCASGSWPLSRLGSTWTLYKSIPVDQRAPGTKKSHGHRSRFIMLLGASTPEPGQFLTILSTASAILAPPFTTTLCSVPLDKHFYVHMHACVHVCVCLFSLNVWSWRLERKNGLSEKTMLLGLDIRRAKWQSAFWEDQNAFQGSVGTEMFLEVAEVGFLLLLCMTCKSCLGPSSGMSDTRWP